MKHDGRLHGVEVIGSGIQGLAYAASDTVADIQRLHAAGLCEKPEEGGTVAWIGKLTPLGIDQIEDNP